MFQPDGEPVAPCPVCDSLELVPIVTVVDGVRFNDGHRVKGYKAGSSKFFIDMRSGPSYYRIASQWHHLVRVIDRENDRYTETVRILSTGEIVREVDMPLSEHTDRGGSKNQGGRK